MVAYNKGDLIPEGTRVKVSRQTGPYTGAHAIVVENSVFGRKAWASTRPGTRMTYVRIEGTDRVFGYFTDNLERIENMRKPELVGPKPKPVEEPEFVTPFSSNGSSVTDANGRVVARIQFGGYTEGAYRQELPLSKRVALAQLFAKGVNKLYEEGVDAPAPW